MNMGITGFGQAKTLKLEAAQAGLSEDGKTVAILLQPEAGYAIAFELTPETVAALEAAVVTAKHYLKTPGKA